MSLNFQDGVFRVEGCEHGHLSLSVVDGDGCLKFVAVMSKAEALDLSARLRVVVGKLVLHQRSTRLRRATGRRLPVVQ